MNCSICGKPLGFYVPDDYLDDYMLCYDCLYELSLPIEEDEAVSMTLEEIEAHERAMLRYDYLGG
jgi:hypothetical protein